MKAYEQNVDRDPITGEYIITIYLLTLTCPGPQLNWKYVGETERQADRKDEFYSDSKRYSGDKINLARLQYTPKKFVYIILEQLRGTDLAALRKEAIRRESYYIGQYNSILLGFNQTDGGPGKARIRVRAIDHAGNVWEFSSMTEAQNTLNVKVGSIRHFLYKAPGKYCRKGYRFEFIN